VMDNVPGFRKLFSQAFPSDGGFYSVNCGGSLGLTGPEHPLTRGSGAGFRGIYDLADPRRSRFVIATGESAHPLSPFYADQLPLYREGKSFTLDPSEEELKANNKGTLIFRK
jgi:penicillin amidase